MIVPYETPDRLLEGGAMGKDELGATECTHHDCGRPAVETMSPLHRVTPPRNLSQRQTRHSSLLWIWKQGGQNLSWRVSPPSSRTMCSSPHQSPQRLQRQTQVDSSQRIQ